MSSVKVSKALLNLYDSDITGVQWRTRRNWWNVHPKEASKKCFQKFFVFYFISKIIPAIIAYWNFTKGGVNAGLSRYLARVHSSPFKVISLENVLWDRLINTALLSGFSLYKYDTLKKDFFDSHATFQQLKVKSQEHMNTFNHFLSDAIQWARIRSQFILQKGLPGQSMWWIYIM